MQRSDSSTGATEQRIAGIVLAAGLSRRMGRFKPLLPFGDRPMISRVVESLATAGGIEPIIVVTGHQAALVENALGDQHAVFAHNAGYEHGEMISSVQTGVRHLPDELAAVVLALGDQPAVCPRTVQVIVAAWRRSGATMVIPTHGGRRGHPVLFAARCIDEVLQLQPGETLKSFRQRHEGELIEVEVQDSAILADVDTPADYEKALQLWQARSRP